MKVLVTGGGGFLGKEIIRQLIAKGYEIKSFSRSDYPELRNWGVHHIQGDLANRADCARAVKDVQAVIHTAALAGMWGTFETYYNINFIGTKNILEASISAGIQHFIYTSSPSAIFGNESIENADESIEYPKRYYSHYAQTKGMAEQLVLGLNTDSFQTMAIRPHIIWGKGDPHLVPRLVKRHLAGKLRQIGDGINLVDIVHVSNAAHAHILGLEKMLSGIDTGKAYFIGQGPVNLWQFIGQIFEQLELKPIHSKISFSIAYMLGFICELIFRSLNIYKQDPPMTRFVAMQLGLSHYFSHQNALNDLGYRPIKTIEEGLSELRLEDYIN